MKPLLSNTKVAEWWEWLIKDPTLTSPSFTLPLRRNPTWTKSTSVLGLWSKARMFSINSKMRKPSTSDLHSQSPYSIVEDSPNISLNNSIYIQNYIFIKINYKFVTLRICFYVDSNYKEQIQRMGEIGNAQLSIRNILIFVLYSAVLIIMFVLLAKRQIKRMR